MWPTGIERWDGPRPTLLDLRLGHRIGNTSLGVDQGCLIGLATDHAPREPPENEDADPDRTPDHRRGLPGA